MVIPPVRETPMGPDVMGLSGERPRPKLLKHTITRALLMEHTLEGRRRRRLLPMIYQLVYCEISNFSQR